MEYHRSYAAVAHGLGALALGAFCLVSPGEALAEDADFEDASSEDVVSEDAIHVRLTELRSYGIPESFRLEAAHPVIAEDGRVLYAANTGIAAAGEGGVQDAACTVVVADESGARAISYRYQNKPTGCVRVLAHRDGGFFLRGNRLTTLNNQVVPDHNGGFIARIDANDREVWVLSDRSFIDADEVSQGGPGGFVGRYAGALAPLVYHREMDRLLVFSSATMTAADSRTVVQAHMLDAETGELRVNGLSFGPQGTRGQLTGAFYRESQKDFLLRFSDAQQETKFYTYNGRRRIDTFVPAGKDWTQRRIISAEWSTSQQELYILSQLLGSVDPNNELSVFNGQGELLWSVELGARVDEVALGMAERFWILRDYILIGYRWGAGDYVRVLEQQTGASLGVAEFGMDALLGQSPYEILGLESAPQDSLRLLRVQTQTRRVREDRVDIIRGSPGPADADAGSGGSDAGDVGMPPGGGDGGCAVSDSGAIPPFSALSLAFGLLVFTIADRRRMNRIDRGDLGNDRV